MNRIDEDRDDGKPLSEEAERINDDHRTRDAAGAFAAALEDLVSYCEPAVFIDYSSGPTPRRFIVYRKQDGTLAGEVAVELTVLDGYHLDDADACNRLLYKACKQYVEAFRDEFEPPLTKTRVEPGPESIKEFAANLARCVAGGGQ